MLSMRRVTNRKKRFSKQMADIGRFLLDSSEEVWRKAQSLDTAVRDDIAEGLAHVVHAGYDCLASNHDLTTEGWMSFIDNATADWFRDKGFAEWFALAAANGFRCSRPRILSERIVKVRRSKKHVKKGP
jgi:hypothetical protein